MRCRTLHVAPRQAAVTLVAARNAASTQVAAVCELSARMKGWSAMQLSNT